MPNLTAYNETCAAIGNTYWNHRLFLLHGDARYVDVMERTLYNGLISGVSLDGMAFFYPNPLESAGEYKRQPWFGVACCPGNITRFLASFPGYMYAHEGNTIFVNLFAAGTASVTLADGRHVEIAQETRYPWDGSVRLTITPDRPGPLTINVRIPGWAHDEPVPSDLYRFAEKVKAPVRLSVNGADVPVVLDKGYVPLTRGWAKGDVISLDLPMPVRRVIANDAVEADRGRVALQRGPIVFAAEWPDNPGGRVRNLEIADETALSAEFVPSLLNGVTVIKGRASAVTAGPTGARAATDQPFVAIPYYAWANRGPGEMAVWFVRAHKEP